MTVRILYHHEPEGWWAESPDIDGWTVAGESYEQVGALVQDGVTFALASVADEQGDDFDEERFAAWPSSTTFPRPSDPRRSSVPRHRGCLVGPRTTLVPECGRDRPGLWPYFRMSSQAGAC